MRETCQICPCYSSTGLDCCAGCSRHFTIVIITVILSYCHQPDARSSPKQVAHSKASVLSVWCGCGLRCAVSAEPVFGPRVEWSRFDSHAGRRTPDASTSYWPITWRLLHRILLLWYIFGVDNNLLYYYLPPSWATSRLGSNPRLERPSSHLRASVILS